MAIKRKRSTGNVANPKTMLLSSESPFSVQEAFKTLRTNVSFSMPGSDCKCIGITSPNRGEGKSTIAINLAISLAQINKRVVLIDCDFRLPTVLTKLKIKSEEGLSNYLSGMIDRVPVLRHEQFAIDIVPSGIIPPDASALINTNEMFDVIKLLRESYDYIIIDFPPINIVSDAALLSNVVDGYLIIVRDNNTEYRQVNDAIRQMRFSDAKIIGFVYNGKGDQKFYYKKGKYKKYGKYGYYKDKNYYK